MGSSEQRRGTTNRCMIPMWHLQIAERVTYWAEYWPCRTGAFSLLLGTIYPVSKSVLPPIRPSCRARAGGCLREPDVEKFKRSTTMPKTAAKTKVRVLKDN